ncbi:precorrin-6Y C5,15-methyltransferase (decarboxylating) subunit CbiT [Halopenitus persicus]|uniref:Cobalt-precorrin-6B (C15)-methyltransferase n=1 Tax=Halopenitus persicus TaxID=1048396 RepID=A0A1H3J2K6_9EURY|nr:precorrin-6Y C5,15-methyltransferase (decarboxylating) subunit CbiT [Halopenitus persicus]SDY34142.1 cobalt-precorrin-6B (C15)-methyltransferase [Halopenitus persicus]
MAQVSLPHDAKAGPTKPAVRAVLLSKLDLDPTDHLAEVGSCTGAVTVEAARRAGRVTAIERKPDRAEVTRKNLAANGIATTVGADVGDGGADVGDGGADATTESRADVEVRETEAPAGLPADADVLFLGGSRNYEAVLDHAVEAGVDRVVMNVSRLEVAGAAATAFRDRGLLEDVLQFQVSHGYELAGATSFESDNPVYMLVGGAGDGEGIDR